MSLNWTTEQKYNWRKIKGRRIKYEDQESYFKGFLHKLVFKRGVRDETSLGSSSILITLLLLNLQTLLSIKNFNDYICLTTALFVFSRILCWLRLQPLELKFHCVWCKTTVKKVIGSRRVHIRDSTTVDQTDSKPSKRFLHTNRYPVP